MAAAASASAPAPLPSLPSSPVEEADIGRESNAWHDQNTSSSGSTLAEGGKTASPRSKRKKSKDKGKGRSTREGRYTDDLDESLDEDAEDAVEGYPPTKDDEAESRRVEENLRRWEMAERQRRKAARVSQQSAVAAASTVGDVTRKASLLWRGTRNKRPSIDGAGSHHILQQSNDDGVPLDDLDTRLTLSPNPDQSRNPFATPNVSTTSLNTPYDSAVMTATTSDPHLSREPTLDSSKAHPPPAPLDLPQPRSPPPRTSTPHTNRPPEPIPPPAPSPMPEVEDIPPEKTRWWTDWLCGCSERGDSQAARTNPFE
ncbi:hypothetical protein EIP91_007367 [Steccherinum ochraceum]|uniref:Uncharacterized protein n=1 Tax=Steccherinum ochraceum TaxID=92696 RepID=A0A4R0RRT2_9APHY|nr:hypothetical protein EIP91_007367 [Steccherinum ochraceum]